MLCAHHINKNVLCNYDVDDKLLNFVSLIMMLVC